MYDVKILDGDEARKVQARLVKNGVSTIRPENVSKVYVEAAPMYDGQDGRSFHILTTTKDGKQEEIHAQDHDTPPNQNQIGLGHGMGRPGVLVAGPGERNMEFTGSKWATAFSRVRASVTPEATRNPLFRPL